MHDLAGLVHVADRSVHHLRHALDRHARLRERIIEALAGLQDVAQSVRQRRADSLALLDDRLRQLLRLVIDTLHVARPRLIDADTGRDRCGGADHGEVEATQAGHEPAQLAAARPRHAPKRLELRHALRGGDPSDGLAELADTPNGCTDAVSEPPDGVAEADSYEGADGRNGEPQVVGQQADGISGDPDPSAEHIEDGWQDPTGDVGQLRQHRLYQFTERLEEFPDRWAEVVHCLAQHRTERVSSIDHRGADIFQRRGEPAGQVVGQAGCRRQELRSCAGGELRRLTTKVHQRLATLVGTEDQAAEYAGDRRDDRDDPAERAEDRSGTEPGDRQPHTRDHALQTARRIRDRLERRRHTAEHPVNIRRLNAVEDRRQLVRHATEPSAEPIGQLADVAADRVPCRGRGEVVEHVDDISPGLHQRPQRRIAEVAEVDEGRLDRPLERFNVTLEVVGLRRCHPLSGTHVVDRGCVLIDRCSATLHEDRRRTHSIGAEQRCQRLLALRIAQPAETRLQLAGHLGDADELPLRVEEVEAQPRHRISGLVGLRHQTLQHRLERSPRVGADQGAVGEHRQDADRLLHRQPGLLGDQATLAESVTELADISGRLVRTRGQHVGDVCHLIAAETEHVHRLRRDRRSIGQVELAGGGKAERSGESTAEHIGDGDARLDELGLGVSGLRRRIDGVSTRLQRCVTQRLHLCSRGVRHRPDAGHRSVEVARRLDRRDADDAERCGSHGRRAGDVAHHRLHARCRHPGHTGRRLLCTLGDIGGELRHVAPNIDPHGPGLRHQSPLPEERQALLRCAVAERLGLRR